MSLNRRKFIRHTSIALAGTGIAAAVPMELLASFRKNISPSEQIRIGVIGLHNQGWNDLISILKIPEVTCHALCDIDQSVLDQRKTELAKINIKPVMYSDYRKMLDDKNIDVVIIATPDHWHCLQMADACSAGKDILLEKPVANSIYESQVMIKSAGRYNRIIQVNQWQRSMDHFKKAISFVQSGKLGKISATKAWMYRAGTTALPVVPNEPVPPGVNYKMWLGPAPERPFNRNRFHYEFRWFWDYAGGLMTDWGVHLIDMVLLGMKADLPKSIIASGGKYVFPQDARETPDVFSAIYDFGNFQMTWEHNLATGIGNYGMQHGIAFIGENGTLLLNRSGWEVRADKNKDQPRMETIAWQPSTDRGIDLHMVNFIDAVRSRKKESLNCPLEAGVRVAINAHMGNIALRSGEKINWNATKNKFEEPAADKLVKPDYHNGWKLPKTV